MGAGEKKPHPLSEPTVTDRREVMERGVKLLFADKGKPLPRPLSEWRGE